MASVLAANKVYKIKPLNYRGANDLPIGLLVKGYSASIQIKGSMTTPAVLADVVNIGSAITANGLVTFDIFPTYIYITGTFTSIELINYVVEEDLGGPLV
jgi:hypothetical protein